MRPLSQTQNIIMILGGVLMVAGAAVNMWLPFISAVTFGMGTLAFGTMQALQQYKGNNFIIRRLRRQQLLGAVCFVGAATLMVMQAWCFGPFTSHEWVLFLAIGCVLEFYTAIRIPTELEKDSRSS